MKTPEHLLYHMPGSCSRVALHALEETGAPYAERGVALLKGEQRGAAFLAINPKGKVPVLLADGSAITELPVILLHLHRTFPSVGLLPEGDEFAALSDLIWLAGALHPIANRAVFPHMVSKADADHVKSSALAQLEQHAALITTRLERAPWWFGERWSIVDALASWIFDLAAHGGFPIETHATLAAHGAASRARAAFGRTCAIERHAVERDGLPIPPGMTV